MQQDRPVVREGRMLRPGREEVVINRTAADELGVGVGDRLPVAFWVPSYNTPGLGPGPDDMVTPVGRVEVTVVGIVVFADEVLTDQLYPIGRVLVDYELAEPFTCDIGDITAVGDTLESLASIVPPDCAMSYRYYSLRVDGGADGAVAVAEEIVARFDEENLRVPPIARQNDIGYQLIPIFTEEERVALDRARSPGVTALRLFGTAAGAATVALGLLVAYRITRRVRRDALVWRQLGVPARTRVAALASSLVVAAAVGSCGALVIGWVASGLGPIGSSAQLEVGIHRDLPPDVLGLVGGIGLSMLVLGLTAVAATLARRPGLERLPRGARTAGLTRRLRPAAALGVSAATTGPAAGVVLVGGVVAVGIVAATTVFAGNVSTLLTQPARYGWPYDAAVVIGFGYGGGNEAVIEEALDRPEVERWGGASLGALSLDGLTVGGVAALSETHALAPPVLEGRLPVGVDEVAVGAQTLTDLGIEIGDTVELESSYGGRAARVTGTVVLPTIGPYESIRAESGLGAYLPDALYADLVAQAEESERASSRQPRAGRLRRLRRHRPGRGRRPDGLPRRARRPQGVGQQRLQHAPGARAAPPARARRGGHGPGGARRARGDARRRDGGGPRARRRGGDPGPTPRAGRPPGAGCTGSELRSTVRWRSDGSRGGHDGHRRPTGRQRRAGHGGVPSSSTWVCPTMWSSRSWGWPWSPWPRS